MCSLISVEYEDKDPLTTKESTVYLFYLNLPPDEEIVFLSPSLNERALNFCLQLTSS